MCSLLKRDRTRIVTVATLFLSSVLVLGFGRNAGLANDSRAQVIATFRTFVELNEDFKFSVGRDTGYSGKPYEQLRREVEEFAEGEYIKALDPAKKLICNNGDAELLAEFLRVLLATTNLAYEFPSFVLGEIFICDPELVIKQMGRLELGDQTEIYKTLDWGFRNVTHGRQKDIPNYETLVQRLRHLNPENKK
jgi:hypothetical protein